MSEYDRIIGANNHDELIANLVSSNEKIKMPENLSEMTSRSFANKNE